MKIGKKVLSWTLCLMMVVVMLPISTREAKASEDNGTCTIKISVVDADDSTEIRDAEIIVTKDDEDNTLVDSWTTDENVTHEVENVKPGNYIIKEVSSPDGYNKVETEIKINVSNDGKITLMGPYSTSDIDVADDGTLILKNQKKNVVDMGEKYDGISWNKELQKYEISNYNGLLTFAKIVNGELSINDILPIVGTSACAFISDGIEAIDASASDPQNPGYDATLAWTPIGNDSSHYTGTFDGNGCTIKWLTIDSASDCVGLFGYVGEDGCVQNVNLEGGSIKGNNCVGGVAGVIYKGTVSNCYNTGAVSGDLYVGGVVGLNNGEVENCYYDICTCQVDKSIGDGSAGTNVMRLTTAQMTGEGKIGSDKSMNFTWEAGKESPWLEMDDTTSGDKTYWHYPHLKGFEYDNDKSEVNWPAKIEVTVKWDSDSYTYNGAEWRPSMNGVLVVSGDTIIPDALKKKNICYFRYESVNGWGNVDDYSDPGYYKMEFYEDSSSPAIAIKYFSVLETGDISVNHGGTASWKNAGTYTASVILAKYGNKTVSGEFEIMPAYVTITAQDKEFTYTGEAQNWNQYDVTGLVGSDKIIAVVTGSITYPNESPVTNKLESYEFTTGRAGNYNVTIKNGTLTMTQARIPITITAASQEWVYDGQAHENAEVTITSGALLTGDELVASATGSITSVSDNKEGNNPVAAGYKIMHGDKDVTENYVITTVAGTLKVSSKTITITADSASKEYDKTELTKESYTSSGLANGDTIKSVAIAGSQTMKGSSDNVPSAAKIVNAKGEDVTDCYEITYKSGTLTVTKPDAPALSDDQKPAPKKDLKEDGKEQVLVLDPANLPEGYTIEYSSDGGKTWVSVPTGKESGEYTIEVFYKADENHTDFFGDPLNIIIQGVYNQTDSDGDWTKGSGKTYTFRIKKAFNDEVTYDNLTGVFVDGKPVEAGKDYTAAKGSAIITFAADYLETLSVGEHKIRVTFKDGEVTVPLKVLAAIATPAQAVDATPTTGDTSMPILWATLILLSMAGAAVVVMRRRKRA